MAFAGQGKVVYGKAFDAVRIIDGTTVNFDDLSSVEEHLSKVVLYEVESTRREDLPADFSGYFFSLSTAELPVAQSLGAQFRFVFVNRASGSVCEMSLVDLYGRTKTIYPSWSIRI